MNLPIRGYKAVEGRGLIDENTTIQDFIDKMDEELKEIKLSLKDSGGEITDHVIEEITDLRAVCINATIWAERKPDVEYMKVIIKNENRKV